LSLPREIAKHPTSGEPILAGIGRFGPYVQHGKTYANLGSDDDVLEIGGNRAIDLIVAKESGTGNSRFGRAAPSGRALGEHPAGGTITVRAGRYGPYVNWGKVNATLPKDMVAENVTLEDALRMIEEKSGTSSTKIVKAARAKPAAAAKKTVANGEDTGTAKAAAKPKARAAIKAPTAKLAASKTKPAEGAPKTGNRKTA
jgi:DNA topoisomerase-1